MLVSSRPSRPPAEGPPPVPRDSAEPLPPAPAPVAPAARGPTELVAAASFRPGAGVSVGCVVRGVFVCGGGGVVVLAAAEG